MAPVLVQTDLIARERTHDLNLDMLSGTLGVQFPPSMQGRGVREDIDRILATPGLNLHLLWLRGNDVRNHLKVRTKFTPTTKLIQLWLPTRLLWNTV